MVEFFCYYLKLVQFLSQKYNAQPRVNSQRAVEFNNLYKNSQEVPHFSSLKKYPLTGILKNYQPISCQLLRSSVEEGSFQLILNLLLPHNITKVKNPWEFLFRLSKPTAHCELTCTKPIRNC